MIQKAYRPPLIAHTECDTRTLVLLTMTNQQPLKANKRQENNRKRRVLMKGSGELQGL